ncbi:hypothetical protein HSR121_2041 [Halapricum desulfuricans]|uniref:Uncharacterized protein n=1 Tax=Halapricum desulfuricans TaxID=2841257 RepID=A0A897N554_9EURY|nr:hypothetical protein HSR121_2041 [Halapricum desulfuricans]
MLDYVRYDKEDFDNMRKRMTDWAEASDYPTYIFIGVSNRVINEVEADVKEQFRDDE